MTKVANTSLSINIQATLWSASLNQWLITSTKENDVPLAIIVDEECKNVILRLQDFYNSLPVSIIKVIKNHYSVLIAWAHRYEAEAEAFDTANSQHSLFPLVGITKEEIIEGDEDTPTIRKIEYIINNEPMRYIQACVDEELYTAISAIADDWRNNQKLYHYVITKYISKFESYVLRNKEENEQ